MRSTIFFNSHPRRRRRLISSSPRVASGRLFALVFVYTQARYSPLFLARSLAAGPVDVNDYHNGTDANVYADLLHLWRFRESIENSTNTSIHPSRYITH